jgi:hypothetical protein
MAAAAEHVSEFPVAGDGGGDGGDSLLFSLSTVPESALAAAAADVALDIEITLQVQWR